MPRARFPVPSEEAWAIVPASQFVRGTNDRLWDQAPSHSVRLSSSVRMGKSVVGADAFRQFRPDLPIRTIGGAVAGISWHDAMAYCAWRARRTGRPCRLPTEAEWERVFRTPGHFGATPAPSGVREWCLDDYGDYPTGPVVDPVGREGGACKVIRGGPLDAVDTSGRIIPPSWYAEPTYRAAMPPAFGIDATRTVRATRYPAPGWIGVWYGSSEFARPQEIEILERSEAQWNGDAMRGGDWSAEYRGRLVPVASGVTVLRIETELAVRLWLDDRLVVDTAAGMAIPIQLERGHAVAVRLRYRHRGGRSLLRVAWDRPDGVRELLPASAMAHLREDREFVEAIAPSTDLAPGAHAIGFRVVEAPLPGTKPLDPMPEFHQIGVAPATASVRHSGDPAQPWFRRRAALPTPLESSVEPRFQREIDAAGFHPSFRGHNHSPALEVCDNGDVFATWYTSWTEYEPEVSLICARLRRGADQWDFPSRLTDFAGANDHAPLLWKDRGVLRLFWGSPRLAGGGFPFQWRESRDHGTTWGPVRFPRFITPIGPHARQPINTAFRDPTGAWWVASDAIGGSSVFWCSRDEGRTWSDPGGRTAGRHTVGAALRDGRLLAIGGKNTDVDGWMPQAISADGGRSWTVQRTQFPAQGGNQRPSLVRLASGRLFFAADFQRAGGARPAGETRAGSYAALSSDEGRTWTIKPIPGVLAHETGPEFFGNVPGAATLGYSVARQAPDGTIHLLATMTRPGLHFEMNEAWILDPEAGPTIRDVPGGAVRLGPDDRRLRPDPGPVGAVRRSTFRATGGPGGGRVSFGLGTDASGRVWRHGPEIWRSSAGGLIYEANWDRGVRTGIERWCAPNGVPIREREHHADGICTQRTFVADGNVATTTRWKDQWRVD
ncbi:MAG: exo-alpha-sialidase [Armatimonadota bacterium]